MVEVYAIVSGLAFASQGRAVESGPYLSIMALLVVVMGPFLVLSMVAVHAYASPMRKTYALAALAFMIACVAITSCINFMLLFVSSQPELFSESWRALFLPGQVAGSRIHPGQLRLGLVLRDIDASGGTGLRRGHSQKRTAGSDDPERSPVSRGTGLACGFASQAIIIGILGWGAAGPIVFLLLAKVFGRVEAETGETSRALTRGATS